MDTQSNSTSSSVQGMDGGEPRQITLDEVKLHHDDGDCWLIIRGKVYDVSKYMDKHPGGADLLKDNSNGKDASQDYEDADHTKRAREMLSKYYIGDLV